MAPKFKTLEGGKQVTKFSPTTEERQRDKNGEKAEQPQWRNIIAWGKTAETMGNKPQNLVND